MEKSHQITLSIGIQEGRRMSSTTARDSMSDFHRPTTHGQQWAHKDSN